MADIRAAVPADMQTFWDMTISAYWAWSAGTPGRASSIPPKVPVALVSVSRGLGGAVGLETGGGPAGSSPFR